MCVCAQMKDERERERGTEREKERERGGVSNLKSIQGQGLLIKKIA